MHVVVVEKNLHVVVVVVSHIQRIGVVANPKKPRWWPIVRMIDRDTVIDP